MKPKNFPQRKLIRKLKAEGKSLEEHAIELEEARKVKTKKRRAK